MKLNRVFVACVGVFIAMVLLLEMSAPTRYDWTMSFDHADKNPFGCFVTDSLLSASLPNGYTVTDKTFYQLLQDDSMAQDTAWRSDTSPRRTYMAICNRFSPSETELGSILKMLRRGDNVVLVYADAADYKILDDSLGAHANMYGFYRVRDKLQKRSTAEIIWDNPIRGFDIRRCTDSYPCHRYTYPEPLCDGYVCIEDMSAYNVCAYIKKSYGEYNIVVYREFGRGRLVICCNPLLLTNYAMIETDNHDFVFRMMSLVGEYPVVRTEYTLGMEPETALGAHRGKATNSPLTYFLNHEPLRWAVYMAVLAILLYLVFTARRRQRPIPVVKDVENKSLEFVRLIGTLYYHQHDNLSIVRMKYMFFADRLRREIMADIGNTADERRNAALVAEHTGMGVEEARRKLNELYQVAQDSTGFTDKQMMHCIDMMNEMEHRIRE